MSGIVDSGSGRNLTNTVVGGTLVPDSAEKKFVTFVNELGGVHTIIVDVDHAAQDAADLLQWFEHTRALVTTSASVPGDPNHRTPEQVLATANERMGYSNPEGSPAPVTSHTFDQQGG